MSQTDQKQEGKVSLLDDPFLGFRQMGTQDYRLDNAFDLQRWMCPNCGLIFDYQFSDEEPGWPELDYDHLLEVDEDGYQYRVEGATRQLCSRCGIDFDEHPLLSVKVSRSDFNFTQLTFVIEDSTQEQVVKAIAKSLGKELQTNVLGNSSQVEAFFKSVKANGMIANAYFLIDGDNRARQYPKEPNFIHLEKYCIENYLLDFEICAEISKKGPQQICSIILEIVKQYAKGRDSLLNLLFNRLSEDDITDESLKYVNGKLILEVLLQKLKIKESDFIDKYVAKCQEKSKLGIILPSRVVEVIQNA